MATSAHIGLEREDGTIIYVSCHYDGDLKNLGKILEKHWKSQDGVRKIIERGNMKAIAPKISRIEFFLKKSEIEAIPQEQREKVAKDRDDFWKKLDKDTGIAYLYAGNSWFTKRRDDHFRAWRDLFSALTNV